MRAVARPYFSVAVTQVQAATNTAKAQTPAAAEITKAVNILLTLLILPS